MTRSNRKTKKHRRRKARRQRPRKHYDVEMIRDFLNHFRLEYAINHFENTHEPETVNPELAEQLGRYMNKYNTCGLMAALALVEDGIPQEVVTKARESVHAARAERAKEVLDALDVLEPFLEEAFICASFPDAFMIDEFDLRGELDEGRADDH